MLNQNAKVSSVPVISGQVLQSDTVQYQTFWATEIPFFLILGLYYTVKVILN